MRTSRAEVIIVGASQALASGRLGMHDAGRTFRSKLRLNPFFGSLATQESTNSREKHPEPPRATTVPSTLAAPTCTEILRDMMRVRDLA